MSKAKIFFSLLKQKNKETTPSIGSKRQKLQHSVSQELVKKLFLLSSLMH